MANIFGSAYLSQGTPVSILSHYLSVYTREEISAPPENCEPFTVKNYSIKKAYVACSFKGLGISCSQILLLITLVECIERGVA